MRARELLLVVVAARVPEEHPRSYLSLAFPRNAVDVREKPPTSAFLRNAFLEKGSRRCLSRFYVVPVALCRFCGCCVVAK